MNMEQKIEENRILEISKAKGIGILLVVLGHCLTEGWLKQFIYLFHMPLFFFISGYLFKDRGVSEVLRYIIKKVKNLYIPFIECNLFALIFHELFCALQIYSSEQIFESMSEFLKYAIGIFLCIKMEDVVAPLWFLPILMFCSIGFCILRYLEVRFKVSEIIRHMLIFAMFISVYFLQKKSGIIRAYILVAIGLCFFNVGYIVRRTKKNIFLGNRAVVTSVICFLFLLCGSVLVKINMIQMQLSNPLTFFVLGISGIYWVMVLAINIENLPMRIIGYLGNHSLTILAWHYYAFIIVTIIQCIIYTGGITVVNSFVMYISDTYNSFIQILWTSVYFVVGVVIPLLLEQIYKSFFHRIRG